MKQLFSGLFLLFALAGCKPYHPRDVFTNENVGVRQLLADQSFCVNELRQTMGPPPIVFVPFVNTDWPERDRHAYSQCMRQRGYSVVEGPGQWGTVYHGYLEYHVHGYDDVPPG